MGAAKSRNGGMLLPGAHANDIKALTRGAWTGFLLNATICAVAFFVPLAALVLNFCMWIFWAFAARERKKEV